MRLKQGLFLGLTAIGLVGAAAAVQAQSVTPDRLANAASPAEDPNWLMDNRTYDLHRYSPLNQITPDNVSHLRLAFAVPIDTVGRGQGGAEGYPVINDGAIYIADQFGTPYKIDGKTGAILWSCDTGVNTDPGAMTRTRNVGLALWGDEVVTALGDGRLVACDAGSGEVVWDSQITHNPAESFEGTVLAIKDKLVVGQSAGDWATRGFLAAADPKTGKELWRFNTVPEPGQPGSETWKCGETGNPDCWKTGGAALWTVGSYDQDRNEIIWGTGNPVPMMDPQYRPGDDLYSSSTIALNADTGKLQWYFQHIPGDMTDYDLIGTQLLVDTTVDGVKRNIVALFHRDGFFYRVDRTNGQFIDAHPYIEKLTWTKGIDAKTGKPIEYDPSKDLQVYAFGAQVRGGPDVFPCPHQHGGVNYQATAYNPETGIAYAMTQDFSCYSQNAGEGFQAADAKPGQGFMVAASGHMTQYGDAPKAALVAFDASTGEQVARYDISDAAGNGGTALSPGLVWSGTNDGTFGAFDAKTLKPLWTTNTGNGQRAGASIYSVDGKEYVAILTQPASAHGYAAVSAKPPAVILFVFTL